MNSGNIVTHCLSMRQPSLVTIALNGVGNVYVLGGGWLVKLVQTGIDGLSRDFAYAGGSGFRLGINGFGFADGSTVRWDGMARTTTFGSSSQLTADITEADLSRLPDISSIAVTVSNRDGTVTPPTIFNIFSANVDVNNVQSDIVNMGLSTTVSTAPTAEGQSGVTAQVSNNGNAVSLAVTVANYTNNPTPGTYFDAGGGYLDVQVTGADPQDTVTSFFYYSSSMTGATEDNLVLLYYNGTGWLNVLSSGGKLPDKDTADDLDGTRSGGRFAVLFDNSSTPTVTELSGTVFAAADGSMPLISGVSASPNRLWPPNKKMVLVSVNYTVTAKCGVASTSLTATTNEPDKGSVQLVPGDAHHLYLRADRSGSGNGLIYTITISCTDLSGRTATQAVTVTVPHDQGKN